MKRIVFSSANATISFSFASFRSEVIGRSNKLLKDSALDYPAITGESAYQNLQQSLDRSK
jgi:hypothetical protein